MPGACAPFASAALFAFGGTPQGAIDSRASILSNQGAIDSGVYAARPWWRTQCRSVRSGVRNELVQFTVVPPPTQRPCRMLIARSAVLRAADSW